MLVFGLSKMEFSFITVRKGGCNTVYDVHVYTFDRKKDSGVMYWQCKGKRTLQCKKARLYSRCLGGVEACYSSLQFNYINRQLLRLYGIYSRIYSVKMWNHHESVDFEIFNAILLILHYNFIMNYSSP